MLAAGLFGASAGLGQSPPARDPAPGNPGSLEQFRRLGPAERLRLLGKVGLGESAVAGVRREILKLDLVERGSVEAAHVADVVCRLRARAEGKPASTIRWLIANGSPIKKGDKLVELDDGALQEELRLRTRKLAAAAAALARAQADLDQARGDQDVGLRLAAIELRLAEGHLKKAGADDADAREELELKVERARLALERLRGQAKAQAAKAGQELRARADAVALEKGRKKDVEEQLARCVLRAPCNGVVLYYVPEQARFGTPSRPDLVAVGEPVREGQKLLQVADLSQMQVNVRVHEALVAYLRNADPRDPERWQRAAVRVDAFPGQVLPGHVRQVATVAATLDWFSTDVKVYATVVTIDAPAGDLKPGMSAEVTITAAQTARPVLQVPVGAIVAEGEKRSCFVVNEKGIQEVPLTTGLKTERAVEVKAGLKAGDRVLLSPRLVARRIASWLDRSGKPQARARPGPAPVVVRSVKPAGDAPRRSWVAAYGLTYNDWGRIAALPTVRRTVPVRSFPQDARRQERTRIVQLVATTPAFADALRLDVTDGRFLVEEDGARLRNVAVLGSAVAEELFAMDEPLGGTVILGRSPYVVVGILAEQDETAGGRAARDVNHSVYLPLKTVQHRFGDRVLIRRGGSRSGEAVALTEILVTPRRAGDVAGTARDIEQLLRELHARQDWTVATAADGMGAR